MIVKRYRVANMQEAMALIRAELGPDAVILSTNHVRKKGVTGLFSPKELEVVAAYEPRLESPKAKEEREAAALATALGSLRPQAPRRNVAPVPPTPGEALGPMGGIGSRPGGRSVDIDVHELEKALRQAQGVKEPPKKTKKPQPASAGAPAGQQRAAQAAARYAQIARPDMLGQDDSQDWLDEDEEGEFQLFHPPEMEINADTAQQARIQEAQYQVVRPANGSVKAKSVPPVATPKKVPAPKKQAPAKMADKPPQKATSQAKAPVPKAAPVQPLVNQAEEKRFEELNDKIAALSGMMEGFVKQYNAAGEDLWPASRVLMNRLIEGEVDAELAQNLVRQAQEEAAERSVEDSLRECLRKTYGQSAPLTFEAGKRMAVFFMGSTGVGKTTTLVKLATMCAVREGLKVGLINTDTYRIAAQEQLRTYADILGVPLHVVYAPEDIAAAAAEMADCDVVFVDTAGKPPNDPEHRDEMSRMLSAMSGWDCHMLVTVSASTSYRSMQNLLNHCSFVDDFRLVVTKTDETVGLGATLHACHLSGKPLAYITGGQSVPDDISEADVEKLIEELLL